MTRMTIRRILRCANNVNSNIGRRLFRSDKEDNCQVVACSERYEALADIRVSVPHIYGDYSQEYQESLVNPEEYWAKAAEEIVWHKKWNRVLDNSNPPFTKWFSGGMLNTCYNALDRHVDSGRGNQTAIIYDSPITKSKKELTYGELLDQVSRLAQTLIIHGVKTGDRVLIYMPMVPEAIVAMMAVVRIGAVHSLVFGGFASRELATRIRHCRPKVIITASCGIEPNRLVRYKPILNEALSISGVVPNKVIMLQRKDLETAEMKNSIDEDWEEAISRRGHDAVPVESNDPLYILYTSGTTGSPKGVQRPTGGHTVVLPWTMKKIYGMAPGERWWAASDLGWVVGHSFICYAPLLAGCTTLIYEGKPVGTPDPGQFSRVVSENRINSMFTAPTALRAIKGEDRNFTFGRKYDISCLRSIFVAGEHCDYETRFWAEEKFQVPLLDNWWQTETGHPITAACIGLGDSPRPPRDSSGRPVPGWNVRIVDENGRELERGELGRIVCKTPLPPGSFSTLFEADEKYKEIYFSRFPGYYDTMDAGMMDEEGRVYVMAREDDVINVAGHRLSTSALEEAILEHQHIVEAAVVGAPDQMKGEIPIGLYVTTSDCEKEEEQLNKEVVALVRRMIGPVAAFRLAAKVQSLPKTRSGKIARKSISDLARSKLVKVPPTIEDASVYIEIKKALQKLGYALEAPYPK
ncbi:acyl-CoA synthetase short-chain family member 3, mitochondrial-like [Artemia franciscana]|uniref:Acyl-CoA synthetase short-chain family member 3, mitochondrial n=1 Tax=Artemia franciscana TaxID=6661 RepID=A0AA88HVJ1_ARTSF|nr:hypothetical protein QYM36_006616 [Artemia franciscana]